MTILYFEKHIIPKSCLLLVFFLTVRTTVFGQLNADFTASVTAGCTPLFVQFTDLSSGDPTQWFWDLGDGTLSTQANPGIIYITPGSYTVKLKIKNTSGEDSIVKTSYITVYDKPEVNFSADPLSGCFPLLVNFSDRTEAGSGTLQSWLWDFGDGSNSTEQNPAHLYGISDTFTVTLKVTNSFGCTETNAKSSFISVSDTILSDFSYTYSNVCRLPVTLNFTNLSQSSVTLGYQWLFGDGSSSTQRNPNHTYTASGTYDVTLISYSNNGCSDTVVKTIAIGAPQADFSMPPGGCIGMEIMMKDSSAPAVLNASWDFGDGTTGTGSTVTHIYNATGVYTVTFHAGFGGCSDTIRKNIEIGDLPEPSFTTSSVLGKCAAPLLVQFTNTSAGGGSYIWDFGDGTTSTEISPQHNYTTEGNFTVTLTVFNEEGNCSNTITQPGFVKIGSPVIDGFLQFPFKGCVPSSVPFAASINSPEPIANYLWKFGDGTTSNEANPVHTYNQTGIYDVTLIVSTASGCTDSFTLTKAVYISTRPEANFKAEPLNACASEYVQFTDLTPGTHDSSIWYFGDGMVSYERNPSHHYADTGFFSVVLVVSNNGCTDSLLLTNYVYIKSPIAKFQASIDCRQRFKRTFTDLSVGALQWNWDFGDGATDNVKSPVHIYADTGKYDVRLIVTNESCADTFFLQVNIIDEDPDFMIEALSRNFCKNDSIRFTATNYNISNISTFRWSFGDGDVTSYSINNTVAYHKYDSAGVYYPTMYVVDKNSCRDTVALRYTVNIYGPKAAFSNVEGVCKGSNFIFNDESTGDGTHSITSWYWDYGDGVSETLSSGPFQHLYANSGTYDVKLIVTDTNACTDTAYKPKGVTIADPVADFTLKDTIKCTGNNVQTVNKSVGITLKYNWNFGDGGTSTTANPYHSYAKEGIYSIKLSVSDKFGCKDSILKENIVTISNPVASFTISDSAASCPPLQVNTKNYSQNFLDVSWNFGDGNTSVLLEPSRLYLFPGEYKLQLIAHGYGVCHDTASRMVKIKGPTGTITYSPIQACYPAEVTFKADTQNTASYIWDFGDGSTRQGVNTQTTYTYTSPGAYLPKLILKDRAGCQVAFVNKDTIKISGVKPKLLSLISTGCDSSLVVFTDSSVISSFDPITGRTVDFGDGYTSSALNPTHYYKNTGTYTVVQSLETATGCIGTYSYPLSVEVKTSPVIAATVADSACLNSGLNFYANETRNIPESLSWYWQFGTGDFSDLQNPSYTYTTPGLYPVTLTLSASNGCSDTFENDILILPLPNIDAGQNNYVCLNNSITLQPSGAARYVWDASPSLSCTDCTSPVASPLTNTTYYVRGTDVFGCAQKDSVEIQVIMPTDVSVLIESDTVCAGSSLLLSASGAEKYQWLPTSGLSDANIPNPVATPSASTRYQVIGSDNKSCFYDTAEVFVMVVPLPVFNINDSFITAGAGSSYTIKTTNSPDIVSWVWQPPYNLSCINCAEPSTVLKTNVTYSAQAINSFGCVATDNITIEVVCNNTNVFIPNTFSPNNDSRNDYFFAQGKGLFTIKSMKIFNRWGVMLYSKANFAANMASQGWDGKYAGVDQPTGVYVYIIEIVCDNGTVLNYKGDVTLIR